MRLIVNIQFGSHLYGTATPQSDLDYKGVFIPSPADILLQRAKGSVSDHRQKAEREKNQPGEIDRESYSVQRYLGLVAEGQTVALDILFAPEWAMVERPQPEWEEIARNRPRLLTKKSASFLGYCRQQANKYGIKGSRIATARAALAALAAGVEQHGGAAKLREMADAITPLARRAFLAGRVDRCQRRRDPTLGCLRPKDAVHDGDPACAWRDAEARR